MKLVGMKWNVTNEMEAHVSIPYKFQNELLVIMVIVFESNFEPWVFLKSFESGNCSPQKVIIHFFYFLAVFEEERHTYDLFGSTRENFLTDVISRNQLHINMSFSCIQQIGYSVLEGKWDRMIWRITSCAIMLIFVLPIIQERKHASQEKLNFFDF